MYRMRTLGMIAALALSPPAAGAQALEASRLRAGDSVRIWADLAPGIGRGVGAREAAYQLRGVHAQVARHTADSLALSSGVVLGLGMLTRLEVQRVGTARSTSGAVFGALGGLVLGAVVGGVIGSAATGGFDGENEGYGDGMGAMVGVPVGAVVGAVAGGFFGGRKRTRVHWRKVPLGRS